MKDRLFSILFPIVFIGILVVGIGGTVYKTVIPSTISKDKAVQIAKKDVTNKYHVEKSTAFAFKEKTKDKAVNFDGSFVTFKEAKKLAKTKINKEYNLDDYWFVYLVPSNLSKNKYIYVYQINATTKKIVDKTQVNLQSFQPNVTILLD